MLASLPPGLARAQINLAMSPMIYNSMIGQGAMTPAGRRASSRAPALTRSVAPALVTYVRDPAVSREVVDRFVAHAERTVGPEKARMVREQLDGHDFVKVWSTVAGQDGFRPGSATDALAAYWTLNWAMANGRDITPAQAAGARAQAALAAPHTAEFARLDGRGRQALAETYMLDFIYQEGPFADALKRGDKAAVRTLSDAAEARFQNAMHMNLRALDLTGHGFVPKA